MIPTTANFDMYRNSTSQAPVFVLTMPGLGLTYAMKAGQPGLTPTNTYMKVPIGLTQKIEDLQGKATIGSLTVEIVDVNRTLLALFSSKQWYGAAASLQLGFAGLAYPTDYITLFSGVVETVVPTADHAGWTFTLQDKNRVLKTNVYRTGDDGATPTSKKNPKTLDGNPLALVLDLLENQLAIPAGSIDTGSISSLQNGRLSCTRMLFNLTKAVDSMTFLEQELLRPNGLFHFVRYDGRIAIGDMLAPPTPLTLAFAFTDSNIQGIPSFSQKTIYNWVEFQLDYDGSRYLDTEDFIHTVSVDRYGLQQQLSIPSQGLRTNLQGASRAGITARRIFQRYGGGPATLVSLKSTSLQACIVEVGDYVSVTHRLLENLDTGTLGWSNRICQVMQVQPKYDSGTITFQLTDVTDTLRAGYQLAPDTVPSWPTATAAQRQQYMFEANASSQQSDGTSAAGVF